MWSAEFRHKKFSDFCNFYFYQFVVVITNGLNIKNEYQISRKRLGVNRIAKKEFLGFLKIAIFPPLESSFNTRISHKQGPICIQELRKWVEAVSLSGTEMGGNHGAQHDLHLFLSCPDSRLQTIDDASCLLSFDVHTMTKLFDLRYLLFREKRLICNH